MGYIKLNKSNFFTNADFYAKLLEDKSKLCIALKDNAYGHGIKQMAQLSCEYGIKHTIVKNIEEANIVSKYDFNTILILYEIPKKQYPKNYIFSINSLEDISLYPKNTAVELKLDIGMGRNGVQVFQIQQALEYIKQNDLILYGVFTHFCCADEDIDKTKEQEEIFLNAVDKIKQKIQKSFRIHCANSNGVAVVNNSLYDIARIGIGFYGYVEQYSNYLKPVLSLYANKISSRTLNIGDAIGYGSIYKVDKKSIFSNYDIGYGDGFFRLNERKTATIKNGKPILGRVSMDSLTVESVDDEICIFDNVSTLAKVHDTIEYEILTHLQSYIKRIISEK